MTATADKGTVANVTVPKSELARALRAAAAIKAKHVHLDGAGVVTAYTADVAIRVALDAPSAEGEGGAFVPRSLLAGVLPYLGADVDVELGEHKVKFSSGDSSFEVLTAREDAVSRRGGRRRRAWAQPVSDTPAASRYGHEFWPIKRTIATFEAPTLVEVLRRALPFASRDQTRPILTTVALYPKAHAAAATDSYRLAVIRWDDGPAEPSEDPILVNVDGAISLTRLLGKKLGKVRLAQTETHVLAEFEDVRWSIRRQVRTQYEKEHGLGRFPSWWSLFPGEEAVETTVKVEREDLLAACRAGSAISPRNAPLKLTVSPLAGATVGIDNRRTASMNRRLQSASVEGDEMEIGFNPGFAGDACAVAPVETLTLKLISPLRPAIIEAARDRYLLMPIRLNI